MAGLLLATLGVASACAPTDTAPSDDAVDDPLAARTHPAIAPTTSINAIMVGLVDHAAHEIWDVAREEMAPQTDEDWEEVVHHAIQLAASGTAITAGGTGQLDAGWVAEDQWRQYAADVSDAGLLALNAANARDLDGVLDAGNVLIEACEGCHEAFKPDLPTEGIYHIHR